MHKYQRIWHVLQQLALSVYCRDVHNAHHCSSYRHYINCFTFLWEVYQVSGICFLLQLGKSGSRISNEVLCTLQGQWENTIVQTKSNQSILAFCLLFILQWEKKFKVRLESLQEFPSCARWLSPETRDWHKDKMCCQLLLASQRPSLRYQVPSLSFEVNQTPPSRLTWAEGYIYPKIHSGRAAVIWARIKVPLCTPEKTSSKLVFFLHDSNECWMSLWGQQLLCWGASCQKYFIVKVQFFSGPFIINSHRCRGALNTDPIYCTNWYIINHKSHPGALLLHLPFQYASMRESLTFV